MAPQLSCKAKSLVVCSLAEELNASLSAGIDPGITVERAPDAGGAAGAKDLSLNFLVTGSSHMSRVIPHIRAKGFAVSDLTEKSWHLSKNSFENYPVNYRPRSLVPCRLLSTICSVTRVSGLINEMTYFHFRSSLMG